MSGAGIQNNAERLPVDLSIEYAGQGFCGHGTVINVFPYGFLVHGDYLPVVGTNVSLRIFHPDGQGPVMVESVVVRWRRGFQLGLEILTMTPDAHTRLVALMAVILQRRRCVCVPVLPWFCRCQQVWQAVSEERVEVMAESGRSLTDVRGASRLLGSAKRRRSVGEGA